MKPDKPPPPHKRDRDILRAQNTRSLKTTSQTTSPVPLSSSATSEVSGDDTEPQTPTPSSSSSVCDPLSLINNESGASSSSAASSSSSEKDKGAEMKLYLDKLRELVPYVPRSGKISRVQLIHSAIDYITDLQESLEARARRKLRDKSDQGSRPPLAALSQAKVEANRMSPLGENSSNRPLETPLTSSLITALPSSSTDINPPMGTPPTGGPSGSQSHPNSTSTTPLLPASPGPPSPREPS